MSVAPQANQAPPPAPGMGLPPPPPIATAGSIGAEVDAELLGTISPLEAEAAGFERAQTRAQQDLTALFQGLQPFVAGSAERVAQSYGATLQAQQGIFNQAWSRLNELRGQRASEAQALAQQIGAPVPLEGYFNEAIDVERGAFVPEAAGQLLKASTVGQAAVGEAEAFAGRVFPLKQARMSREINNYYRDQITDLKKQIASIKATKPGLVNERLRQRQLEDYQMRLERAQALFEREQSKRSLKLEEKRLQAQINEVKGNQKQAKAELKQRKNESDRDFALRLRQQQLSEQQQKLGNQTYLNQQKQNIISTVNGLSAGQKQDVDRKMSQWRYVDAQTGEEIPPGTKGGKWELHKWTQTVQVGPNAVRNPTQLLNQTLAALGIAKGQKKLYAFAVGQIVRALKAQGINIPTDPSKWAAWWKNRQQQMKNRSKYPKMIHPSGTGGAPK